MIIASSTTNSDDSASFVHLHGHSHYSLLDGGAKITDLCRKAAEHKMPALALTDHGNLFGLVEFYTAAREAGIKPLLGCEFYIAPGSRFDKEAHGISEAAYHLVVLAKNHAGYKNLIKLASLAYLEGYYYRPRIDKEILHRYRDGLIVINGHLGTEIAACLQRGDATAAVDVAGQYKDMFGSDFFVELQNHDDPLQISMIPQLTDIAARAGCPVVATNDHHYLTQDDYDAHDVLCCISMGKTLTDENRLRYSRELYLKSAAQMRHIFRDLPEACNNTLEIAGRCDVTLDFSRRHAPVYVPAADPLTGQTPSADAYLRQLCLEGITQRYGAMNAALQQRLDLELSVIQGKGFSSYFLIVWDFCNFARSQGIPVGARGSGVGTLVGYTLGLCNVDPIRYDLLFERFMDPSRSEMPDIDIDICQEGRARIIEYVRNKYGNVSQIITFSTLGARAVIKDVGRVMGLPLNEVDAITRLVPKTLDVTLDSALEVPDIPKMYREKGHVSRLFDVAKRLEGLCRNAGMHAAGVIVCDQPIDDIVPLYRSDQGIMTQWDGPTCEKAGLLKMDFLGLRTLTIIQRALDLIAVSFPAGLPSRPIPATSEQAAAAIAHPTHPGRPGALDIEKIDLSDPLVYKRVFQCGKTRGIFQFESPGMQSLLMKMRPDRMEDLIAANALYRPGPMDLIPEYCDRKHGRKPIPKVHPIMDTILAETYGIMVYQEQVMRLFNQLGDIPLARAYKIIKAISKKNTATIAAEKEHFIRGASAKGISEKQATDIFALIEEFGKYGFNKSHSTRYSILAFQTAYLKTHFPLEFMAAVLTFEMVSQEKVAEYIDECRYLPGLNGKIGIPILPPDINQSVSDFGVVSGTIRFGMAAVKGVGQKAVAAILEARRDESGGQRPFKSLFDFCERLDGRSVNKAVVEALVKSGAFDSLHANRAAATTAIENALQAGGTLQAAARAGQSNLFMSGHAGPPVEMELPRVPDWKQSQKMSFEKEMLGFYVTSHPLRDVQDHMRDFVTLNSHSLAAAPDQKEGIIGGLVTTVDQRVVRSGPNAGQKWATVHLEDLQGSIRVQLFAADFQKFGHLMKPESILLIRGRVDRSREQPVFRVTEVFTLEQSLEKLARELVIEFPAALVHDSMLEKINAVLAGHSGGRVPVRFSLTSPDSTPPWRAILQTPTLVRTDAVLAAKLRQISDDLRVRIGGPGAALAKLRPLVAAGTAA